jgi:aminopeptidase N
MQILNRYVNDGQGLHSFTDAVDKKQYLYTQFETDYCHYVFPCFDQPDLKATWALSAVVPEDWVVIANEQEDPAKEGTFDAVKASLGETAALFEKTDIWTGIASPKCFLFKESARVSTYLYAIVAGPYDYHESIVEGLPPMRIYARATLKEDVNHKEMFLVTQCGIRFYTELFGKAYPFGKYDQVFVPEHNAGAMENVGCVTYNEQYMYRG